MDKSIQIYTINFKIAYFQGNKVIKLSTIIYYFGIFRFIKMGYLLSVTLYSIHNNCQCQHRHWRKNMPLFIFRISNRYTKPTMHSWVHVWPNDYHTSVLRYIYFSVMQYSLHIKRVKFS